jgi:hypothetical protein
MDEDIEWIIRHVETGDYLFRRHAAERASERGINPLDVKEALLNGNIVEDYPDDPRGHSWLVCGKTKSGQYLHIVCGCLHDRLWIVTVYEPDSEEWLDPLHRRSES